MLRFPCPNCHRSIQVAETRPGKHVVCPHCDETSRVPAKLGPALAGPRGSSLVARSFTAAPQALGEAPTGVRSQVAAFCLGMPGWLRFAVVLTAGVIIFSLLRALITPLFAVSEETLAAARRDALLLIACGLIFLLVLAYGHATSCPSCGKWLARVEKGTEYLGREFLDEQMGRRVRATRQLVCRCRYCQHTWGTTLTVEY